MGESGLGKTAREDQEPIPATFGLVEVEKQIDETRISRKEKGDSLAAIVSQKNMIR